MTAEQKLKKISAIFETVRKSGRISVTTHAGYNLEGAIIDIERTGKCDSLSLKTLKQVRDQLRKIGKLLHDN